MATPATPGAALRAARLSAGLTQQGLAEAVGMSQGHVAKMEIGKREISVENAVAFAEALRSDWSLFIQVDPDKGPVQSRIAHVALRRLNDSRALRRTVPVIAKANAGAATMEALISDPIDYVERPAGLSSSDDCYAVQVQGLSMVPRYRPGQVLFLEPKRVARAEDGVVVLTPDGGVLIKEFVKWVSDAEATLREYTPKLRDFRQAFVSVHVVAAVLEFGLS